MHFGIAGLLMALGLLAVAPAIAAEEKKASAEEMKKVEKMIAKIGCKADDVEKEAAHLYEVDDAKCEIGQYDIKLDGDFNIVSITKDF
jgi:hypothetical protein